MFDALEENLEVVKFEEKKEDSDELVEVERTSMQLFREILETLPDTIDYSERAAGKEDQKGAREVTGDELSDVKDDEDRGKQVEITGDKFQAAMDKYVEEKKIDVDDPEAYAEAMMEVSKTIEVSE